MPQRTCGTSGCPNAHRAKGLCSSCYNRQHQPNRHRKSTASCSWCGKTTLKASTQRYAGRYCSLACRDAHRARKADERKLPVLFVGQVIRPAPDPPRQRARRLFVDGRCRRCDTRYLAEDYSGRAAYCSTACLRSDSKDRRRARKRKAFVANVSRRLVFERDGWQCQLCRKPVRRDQVAPHPLAPVLDHVVPLARGGTHEPANVQCAHFLCNSIKSDRGTSWQLALFG